MPENIDKKRARDKRYRERQRNENRDAYFAKRRANCNKSYAKRKTEVSQRDARTQRRRKTSNMRIWRKKKIAATICSPDELGRSLLQVPASGKSLSASRREKEKRNKKLADLRLQYRRLQQLVWRLQYQQRKKKKRMEIHESPIKEAIRNTMASKERTRSVLLSHFALMDSISSQTQWKLWERQYIALRVKKICMQYRGVKAHFSRVMKLHPKTINSATDVLEPVRKRSPKFSSATLQSFLERDDNSRASSGKKEVVSRGGKKTQIRFLNFPVQVLHEKFVSEQDSGVTLGRSSFYAHLSKLPHLKRPSVNNRDLCLCQRCCNMQLLVDALYTNKIIPTRDKVALVNKIVCSVDSFQCTHRQCLSCKDKKATDPIGVPVSVLTYYQWESTESQNGATTCVQKQDSAVGLVMKFERMLESYTGHFFRTCHQYRQIRNIHSTLQDGDLVLRVDFSENYTCKWSNEVQSAHFGSAHRQVVIHQGVMYASSLEEPLSFATLSDDLRKTAPAVAAHLDAVLTEALKQAFVNRLIIISDSPSSQYRNRYSIYLLSHLCEKHAIANFEWLYTESGHGKGPADGVGATLKRMADNFVGMGNSVLNANEFLNAGNSSKVLLKLVSSTEIDLFSNLLSEKAIPAMKGISSAHHVYFLDCTLRYRQLACHCAGNGLVCDCYQPVEWTIDKTMQSSHAPSLKPPYVVEEKLDSSIQTTRCQVNEWVVAVYGDCWHLGQIKSVVGSAVNIDYMAERQENKFFWPRRADKDKIDFHTILTMTVEPSLLASSSNARVSHFALPQKEYSRIERLFCDML